MRISDWSSDVCSSDLPLATLGYWLVVGQSAGQGYANIWPAIGGSVWLAISGALITSLFAIPLVLLSIRHKGKLAALADRLPYIRSEEHTSELQSLMRISYAVFCVKKKKTDHHNNNTITT